MKMKGNRCSCALVILLCVFILSGCGKNSKDTHAATGNGSAISTVTLDSVVYDSDDYYSAWESQNPNYIELIGTSANITGQGATVSGKAIHISSPGVYVVSGKTDNGQIIVDAESEGTVRLVLNGAEIKCQDSSPIYVKNADKTVISLQDGTENTLTDGEDYAFPDANSDEPNGAIFSKDDLTINGTGSLRINANYNNGITVKDDLKITGGNIYVQSPDDGLIGRDMIAVKQGNITIEAGGDALKATNDADTSKGFIFIEGGTFSLTSGTDGIQAETSVIIMGGNIKISSGGGSVNSSYKNNTGNPWGRRGSNTNTATDEKVSDETESQSAKGIKSSAEIVISGGALRIDSSDDAIHSNNSIQITGGIISIESGDDGIHADSLITIKGGELNISKSYEGIESAEISISGGNIDIIASDDGLNSAGGNDGSSLGGRPGQNSFSSTGNYKINIDGGYIAIDAAGDGIDANGSVYMSDGTVIINGPTDNGNGPLDYAGAFETSGGLLVAAGSSGMAQAPSDGSTQYSVLMNYDNVKQAGTLVCIKDEGGNNVFAFAPKKQYQSILISSPDLKQDTEYTLYSGGTSNGSQKDGLYTNGECQGGTKITDFTLLNTVTWLTESGVTEGGFNPGRGRPRGMPGK